MFENFTVEQLEAFSLIFSNHLKFTESNQYVESLERLYDYCKGSELSPELLADLEELGSVVEQMKNAIPTTEEDKDLDQRANMVECEFSNEWQKRFIPKCSGCCESCQENHEADNNE